MTPLSEPIEQSRSNWLRRLIGVAALAIVGWLLVTQVISKDGNRDRSADVRAAAGASSCQQSEYELRNRLDGSKTAVYDCAFPSGRVKCVTLENGITHDVTDEMRLLFADTLGASRPSCLG